LKTLFTEPIDTIGQQRHFQDFFTIRSERRGAHTFLLIREERIGRRPGCSTGPEEVDPSVG
jgi:hypothetical protein